MPGKNLPLHVSRLPYGYNHDPAENAEYLFDRKYRTIAMRSLRDPTRVTEGPERRPDGCFQAYFYLDGNSPRRHKDTQRLCLEVLGRFAMGSEVRHLFHSSRAYRWPDGHSEPERRHGKRVGDYEPLLSAGRAALPLA